MNDKVLVISFSFEQEPDAFGVLRSGGLQPLLWAQKQRSPHTTQQDLIAYWNALPEKPRGILMGADVEIGQPFFDAVTEKPAAIALNCAGYDHLDLQFFAKNGVKVCNVPRQNFAAVADLAFGLIISLMRKIPQGDRNIRAGRWAEGVERGMAVSGKTLGILGFGAVGKALAKRGAGFEMQIIACDPYVDAAAGCELGVRLVDRDTLFAQSDILVLAMPATADTHHIVNRQSLAAMKKSAVIVNPSRGALIDTGALLQALQNGGIAGAALDVFETEPLYTSPLFAMDNTVLTPHMGGLADREIHNVAMQAARNMVAMLVDPGCELGIV